MHEEKTNNGTQRWLIGTISGGLSCGKNIPSWYTRVSTKIMQKFALKCYRIFQIP